MLAFIWFAIISFCPVHLFFTEQYNVCNPICIFDFSVQAYFLPQIRHCFTLLDFARLIFLLWLLIRGIRNIVIYKDTIQVWFLNILLIFRPISCFVVAHFRPVFAKTDYKENVYLVVIKFVVPRV